MASETSAKILGGHPLFLGSADSQLGVNETLEDTARVVGSMVDGIMARVNRHDEVAVSHNWGDASSPVGFLSLTGARR